MENKVTPGVAMLFLTVLCLVLILVGLQRVLKSTGQQQGGRGGILLLPGWVLALTILSLTGFFSDFSKLPPRPGFAILIPLPFVLYFAFSKKGTQLLKAVPPHWLIYIQVFRIFVELILWAAYLRNLLPVQMTFEGRNFDILSGLLAIPVGYFCFTRKSWSLAWAVGFNILGLLLLLNIIVVAMLSMPTPLRHFMNEPANTLVGEFPFIYLPGILVPLAYSMHIFSLRQLLGGKAIASSVRSEPGI